MRAVFIGAFATLLLAVGVAADCSTLPDATTTWKPSSTCTNATALGDDACWTNGKPTTDSHVLFPAGSNVTIGSFRNTTFSVPYQVFRAASVVIEEGAELAMTGDAIQVSSCLYVGGSLTLRSSDEYWPYTQTPTDIDDFPADPNQPLGTDCKLVPVGFTPRICGPGEMVVNGTATATNLYSSFFISGRVNSGATLELSNFAFLWSNLTNYGTYRTRWYTYQHGFLLNENVAELDTIAFDKWATSFIANTDHPLLIRNSATLKLNGNALYPTQANYPDDTSGIYRAAVVNYGQVTVQTWLAATGFDIYNMGTVTWQSYYEGDGTYLNRGTFVADGVYVTLNSYIDQGGTLVTENGGGFDFNNGSPNTASRSTMRLCSLVTGMPSRLQSAYETNLKRRKVENRHLHHAERAIVTFSNGCNWYCGFCYTEPYDIGAPELPRVEDPIGPDPLAIDPSGLPVHRHGGDVKLYIQRILAEDVVPVDPCHGRYRFVNTTIRGDGTGSIVTTVPVEVDGTVRVETGGKWHVAAERSTSPVFGGGKIVVRKGGSMWVGIDADFRFYGELSVQRGGLLAVPRHASVAFSNHSVNLQPGAKLHVDGKLNFAERKGGTLALDQCGHLDGIGEVSVEKEGALSCSNDVDNSVERPRDPATKKRHHRN